MPNLRTIFHKNHDLKIYAIRIICNAPEPVPLLLSDRKRNQDIKKDETQSFVLKIILFSFTKYDIIRVSGSSHREEVEPLEYIINLVISIVGGVIGNLISKWFDRNQ